MLETRNNITQNAKNTSIRISEKKSIARAKASNGITLLLNQSIMTNETCIGLENMSDLTFDCQNNEIFINATSGLLSNIHFDLKNMEEMVIQNCKLKGREEPVTVFIPGRKSQ